jgi:hypothetical protein
MAAARSKSLTSFHTIITRGKTSSEIIASRERRERRRREKERKKTTEKKKETLRETTQTYLVHTDMNCL